MFELYPVEHGGTPTRSREARAGNIASAACRPTMMHFLRPMIQHPSSKHIQSMGCTMASSSLSLEAAPRLLVPLEEGLADEFSSSSSIPPPPHCHLTTRHPSTARTTTSERPFIIWKNLYSYGNVINLLYLHCAIGGSIGDGRSNGCGKSSQSPWWYRR